jgi:hypothetical protein
MYRDSVDNDINFTLEDVILFETSPFASWMERLTLEYPEHQYIPDTNNPAGLLRDECEPIVPVQWDSLGLLDKQAPPLHSEKSTPAYKPPGTASRAGIAKALGKGGKNVKIIDAEIDEPLRHKLTLDAMHDGADFIVGGQLAAGRLSGQANLLMRTGGNSQLGDYLYTACDTRSESTSQSTFLLSFLSDLLREIQGQLPPKMLHIRNGVHLTSLQTEQQIGSYLSVKQRFMTAQDEFCSDDTPDPAHSSHFGRWTNCAKEILMRRNSPQASPAPKISPPASVLLPSNASLSAPPVSLRNPAATLSQALRLEPGERADSAVDRDEGHDSSNRSGNKQLPEEVATENFSDKLNRSLLGAQSDLQEASLSAPPASLRNPTAAPSPSLGLETEERVHSLVDRD